MQEVTLCMLVLGYSSVRINRKECLVIISSIAVNRRNHVNQLNLLEQHTTGWDAVMDLDGVRTWPASGQADAGTQPIHIRPLYPATPPFTETVTTKMTRSCHLSIRGIKRSGVPREWLMTGEKGQNIIRGFQVKCSILLLVLWALQARPLGSGQQNIQHKPSEHRQVLSFII